MNHTLLTETRKWITVKLLQNIENKKKNIRAFQPTLIKTRTQVLYLRISTVEACLQNVCCLQNKILHDPDHLLREHTQLKLPFGFSAHQTTVPKIKHCNAIEWIIHYTIDIPLDNNRHD
jgi:hypothetical protein